MKYGLSRRGGVGAMTIRVAATFLTIFATGLIAVAPESSARGGAFAGGHARSFYRGFRAPMVRPAIARPATPAHAQPQSPLCAF
jgi:hypothetical protein